MDHVTAVLTVVCLVLGSHSFIRIIQSVLVIRAQNLKDKKTIEEELNPKTKG